jgi:hypothetical protein
MQKIFGGVGLAAGLLASAYAQPGTLKGKHLIEFGWDEPDTACLRGHIGEMQQSPFDGCVFHADYQKTGGGKGRFTWEGWGTQKFTDADLRQAFEDLQATRFGRFRLSFLRFNTTPGKLDWFEDHTAVVANVGLAARLARAGGGPGLLLDIEQYDGPLFDYRKQRDAKTKSWEVYAAQARRRGQEVMQALQRGYPGLTVFLTFGYSLPWAETENGRKSLADCHYGLLAPFLDGMLAAAGGKTRLVDGSEISYGYKTPPQFVAARKVFQQNLLPIVLDAHQYEHAFRLGFGLWLDYDWRKRGWDAEDLTKNYFTPEGFETAAREALRLADEYVWIYSEKPHWWNPASTAEKIPPRYEAALRKARGEANHW